MFWVLETYLVKFKLEQRAFLFDIVSPKSTLGFIFRLPQGPVLEASKGGESKQS